MRQNSTSVLFFLSVESPRESGALVSRRLQLYFGLLLSAFNFERFFDGSASSRDIAES